MENQEPIILKLKCDNCEHFFELEVGAIQTEFLGGDVEWRFFECPNCRIRFTTYIGDKRVEKGIARRNLYREEWVLAQESSQPRYRQVRTSTRAPLCHGAATRSQAFSR